MEYLQAVYKLKEIKDTNQKQDILFDVERDYLKLWRLKKNTIKKVLELIQKDENL